MESDVEKTASDGQQGEDGGQLGASQPGAGATVTRRSVAIMGTPPGLTGWHPMGIEQQRWVHHLPAASALHLVPDIVVEHVSSLTFSETGTSRPALFSTGLSAPDMPYVSAGRPLRALSDSSVYHLERHQHSSVPDRPLDSGRRATCPLHMSGSPDQFKWTGVDDSMPPELEMEVFSSEGSFREPLSSGLKRHGDLSPPLPVPSLHWQPSLASAQSSGPERSPKSDWLRRHSDSNLATGQNWQTRLRLEPYPIRSHSTGDTLLNVAASVEWPVPAAHDKFIHRLSYEPIPCCKHSEPQRSSPCHLWSVAGRLWQGRSSPTGRKFFSEDARPPGMLLNVSQLPVRSHSENVSSRKCSSRLEKFESTSWVEKPEARHMAMPEVSLSAQAAPVSATFSSECPDVIDMSMREHGATTQMAEGVVEKHLKLKKYLQTRYQMSEARLRRSSDTDDVFTERVASPDRLAASTTEAVSDVIEPTDLSVRSLSSLTSRLQSDDVSRRTVSASSQRSTISPISQQTTDHHGTVFHQSSEHSAALLSASELPFPVKLEPSSPGIVPSGTSVFIFPPSLSAHHDTSEWQVSACRPPASPVPSPLSSGTSEGYHHLLCSPRFVRYPSSLDEEGHNRTAVLTHALPQVTSSSMSDVGAMYHRSGSLSIATQYLPLMMSEASPLMLPYEAPVPMQPALAKQVGTASHGARSGWRQHRLRGRRRSSSSSLSTMEDLASYMCPVCTAAFRSYRLLTDHMAEHVSTSPPGEAGEQSGTVESPECGAGSKAVHLCPICHRSFSRADMLSRHVRLHTGIRPYECTLCSQVFSRSDHLTTHQRTHTGEKPYRCPVCEYAAPRRDMVTRHARIHESSSTGRSGGTRRGRRAGSASTASTPRAVACVSAPMGRRMWRSRSTSMFAPSRHRWSVSTSDDVRSSTSSSRHWSVTSSSMESTDSDMLGQSGLSTIPSRRLPVTCRAWSTTSADSFESYPGAGHRSSSISSAPADSPDAFAIQQRCFRWGGPEPQVLATDRRVMSYPASTDTSADLASVAGVMPALQKCSVTSPAVSDQDPTTDVE